MSDEASKIILAETAVSVMEDSPRRRLLRRRKATEGREITECENCGAPLHGHWCAKCGQAAVEYRRSFRHVIIDVLDSFLNWDSKFFSSLGWLIARPWFLTNEFVMGHRVRYLHPIRLYLLASIIFFFVINYSARSIHMDTKKASKANERKQVEDALKNKDIPENVRAKIDAAFKKSEPAASPQPEGSTSPAESVVSTPAESVAAPTIAPKDLPSATPVPARKSGTDSDEGDLKLFHFDPPDAKTTPFEKWLEARAKEKLGEHGTKAELFVKTLLSNLPYMMLCCIPLFALVLKLLYIRHRIFYIDHLVYALHIHSFAYIGVMLILFSTMGINRIASGALAGWLIALLWIAFSVQVFLSIRKVYRQGWIKSFIKFWVGGAIYLVILLLGLAGTFFATLVIP